MRIGWLLFACGTGLFIAHGCSAAGENRKSSGESNGPGGGGIGGNCGMCAGLEYTPCENGEPGDVVVCPVDCAPGLGCTDCVPTNDLCVGNEVHACNDDGTVGELVETCDPSANLVCSGGACIDGCIVAEDQASNIGCEFWAVDMDQVDSFNDPASAPWGVAISNASDAQASVVIEINEAPQGQPLLLTTVDSFTVPPNALQAVSLPTREVDCGITPNDYAAPGTCLSSQAYRITSTAPIVVYQFNVFENAFSNDASLLLPTNALGQVYRVLGWNAGHPVEIPVFPGIIDRSAVTIIGTQENTTITVKPSWRIRGNPPIAATAPGTDIVVTIGPFDVLNLETDNGTFSDDQMTIADLSGTLVLSDKPVAVFSGVETTQVPYGLTIPTYPGWDPNDTCCLDHLEEQMFPVEAVGTKYVITRSPIRSTGSWAEPDVLRFIAPAEIAQVTTTLPAPYDSFTMQPGEVVTTYTQEDVIVTSDKPVMVGQLLISQGYIEGAATGDPALTVFPPVEQYRTEYVILTPGSWTTNWVVFAAEVGATITIDGAAPTGCVVTAAGDLEGVMYESRRCPLNEGAHAISGDSRFGVVAYGYGNAGSYAFAGGADVKKIYEPPPLE
jgi:hypothetical protein